MLAILRPAFAFLITFEKAFLGDFRVENGGGELSAKRQKCLIATRAF